MGLQAEEIDRRIAQEAKAEKDVQKLFLLEFLEQIYTCLPMIITHQLLGLWFNSLKEWTTAEKGSKFWGQIEVAAGSLRFLKSEYNSPSLVQQYCSPEQHCWHTQRSVFFVAGFFYDSPTVWIFHDWAHTSLGSSKGMYRQGMCVKNIIYLIYSNNMWWVCKCECMYSKSLQENAYSVLSVCTVKVYKRMHIQYWVDVQFMSQRCEQYYVYKC